MPKTPRETGEFSTNLLLQAIQIGNSTHRLRIEDFQASSTSDLVFLIHPDYQSTGKLKTGLPRPKQIF